MEHQKISAAWAVDEDISRLLKSLPNWTNEWSPIGVNGEQTPIGVMNLQESEQEIRHRTQRESDILIGNLGTQKQIKQEELISDMDHVKNLSLNNDLVRSTVLKNMKIRDIFFVFFLAKERQQNSFTIKKKISSLTKLNILASFIGLYVRIFAMVCFKYAFNDIKFACFGSGNY